MATPETYLINFIYLENRLSELDLKNWWVAEHIGVDRKTLTRWLTGQVKSIKHENLVALANCLKCAPEDLVLKDESTVIASKEEQALAAQLVVQDNLLATLTPLGQWPLLESIVKATMQPNLPAPLMGKLYNLLSICAWRQGDIDKARSYAEKAMEIGTKLNYRNVIVGAKNNLAITSSYKGHVTEAIRLYEEVVAEEKYLDDERAVAAAYSNLGSDYRTLGKFEESRKMQMRSIEIYTKLELPTNLSIAYCGLGLLETALEHWPEAESALEKSLEYADEAGYIRGLHACNVYLADVLAQSGRLAQARKLLDQGLAGFKKIGLEEALNYEIAARICRIEGRLDEAEEWLRRGFVAAEGYPSEIESLQKEQKRLLKSR